MHKSNTAADSGVFYGFKSESDCVALCLTSLSCVGFDITPFGCTLHHGVGELTDSYYSPGVTQFVLNRHCLPVTPLSTGGSYTTKTSLPSTTSRGIRNFASLWGDYIFSHFWFLQFLTACILKRIFTKNMSVDFVLGKNVPFGISMTTHNVLTLKFPKPPFCGPILNGQFFCDRKPSITWG